MHNLYFLYGFMGGVKTRTFIMYEVCNNVLPKYQLIATLTAHLLTRAVCREQDGVLRHVGRQGGQRASVQTWPVVMCHVSHLSQLNDHKLRAALRRYGNQPISYNLCVGDPISHLVMEG